MLASQFTKNVKLFNRKHELHTYTEKFDIITNLFATHYLLSRVLLKGFNFKLPLCLYTYYYLPFPKQQRKQ